MSARARAILGVAIMSALLVLYFGFAGVRAFAPVSYTHLDVYKRQALEYRQGSRASAARRRWRRGLAESERWR